MDVSPGKRAGILTLLENIEKTGKEISKTVGVSISTISCVVKIKKKQGLLPQNTKTNAVVRGKRFPEMMSS